MGRIWELVLILVIIFIFFGAGKLPNVMGDIGKSIRNFKDGLKGEKKPEEKDSDKNKEEKNS
jgi:sec-independent protein translocase protein TatA